MDPKLLVPVGRAQRTIGPNGKNPPKIRWKKIVKMTDYTCAGDDLTNLKYVMHAMAGNKS
jgi:hypothetical protein